MALYKGTKTQAFKPSTKKTITDNLIKKALENKEVIPVASGEIVQYKAQDGTKPFYKVLNAYLDPSTAMYDVQVQKIGYNGEMMTQNFSTTMDKLTRYWLQLGDEAHYTENFREGGTMQQRTLTGKVTSIYLDRDGEIQVDFDAGQFGLRSLNEKDLNFLTLIFE